MAQIPIFLSPGNGTLITEDFLQSPSNPKGYILVSIYIPIFLLSLIGNFLVIIVLGQYQQQHRGISTSLLINLAWADLLVTFICIPTAILKSLNPFWSYGSFMCKIAHYMTGVSVGSSVFSITSLSIERYLIIKRSEQPRTRNALPVLIRIWGLALVIQIPILIIRKVDGFQVESTEFLYCIEEWPSGKFRQIFGVFSFISLYAIPGLTIILAYSLMGVRLWFNENRARASPPALTGISQEIDFEGKRRIYQESHRIVKLFIALALVFAICWLPYSICSLLLDLSPKLAKGLINTEESWFTIGEFLPFTILLGHSNSALNPMLYLLLNGPKFRQCMLKLVLTFRLNKNHRQTSSTTRDDSLRLSMKRPPPPDVFLDDDVDQQTQKSGPDSGKNVRICQPELKERFPRSEIPFVELHIPASTQYPLFSNRPESSRKWIR